jgi:hypothetical protein
MTATIMPPDILEHLTPEFIAPVVGVLTAPEVSDTESPEIVCAHIRFYIRDPTSMVVSLNWVPGLCPRSGVNEQRVRIGH